MSRSETKRVLKYIKKGSVSKLRNFIRKHDVDLNKIHDSQGRSVLHLACYLGEGRVTRCLLRCGADPCITDMNGNTPLHTALDYTLEFKSNSAFVELVLPLKKKSKRVIHLRNNQGTTPEELFVKLKAALKKDFLIEEEIMVEEEEENQNEKEWLEKLAYENSCEDFYFKEAEDDSPSFEKTTETYHEWAERIQREYYAKRTSIVDSKGSCQTTKQDAVEDSNTKLTKKLAKEHDEYIERIRLKARTARLGRESERYEQKCKDVFEDKIKEQLRFSEIPWPCAGSAADIVEKLAEWAEVTEVKIKYLKLQRVRWHPDRFLQRCQHRIKGEDREKIMDLVKQISQGINALITSL